MTDNFNNNEYSEQNPSNSSRKNSWTDGNSEMIRMLSIALSSFLGAFLAMALLGRMIFQDNMIPKTLNQPADVKMSSSNNMSSFDEDEMFREINRDFELMAPKFITPIAVPKFHVVKLEENSDNYKVIIDLKQFHDNEKNVVVDVKPNSVKISGKAAMKSENAQSSFSYFQEMPLYKKVDVDDVKKEKIGNNYVITLPFED